MGALVPLLETTWPWSDLSARPCLASAASERHFSPGSPEETPLHTMLFLPAAALCWLGSALAAMATHLVQDDLTLTRRTGQSVSFSCGGTDQCGSNYVYWYQKKETETFRAILYISSGGSPTKPYNHPQQDDFSAERDRSSSSLKINKVKLDHSASYYCGCWKSGSHTASERHFSPGSPEETPLHTMLFLPAAALCWLGSALAAMATHLVQDDLTLTRRTGQSVSFSCGGTDQCGSCCIIWTGSPQPTRSAADWFLWRILVLFGSGTRLDGTGDPVVKPMVSVYPAASSARRGRRGFLLCLASGMFPPEVKFTWKRLEDDGEKDLTSGEQLELREPNRTASILLVDRDLLSTSRYRCSVQHEGGPVEAPTTQEVCPWILMILNRVKLLCLLYSVLIVKSLVYCSGLSLLMVLRNKGPAPSCSFSCFIAAE
ncbi:uncharacterized protein LOC111608882 [Xiphophorus maculatus]|uniref:uncharacterized protein LOC111608882 n=1 Tax=Xiphophorus maculatus TaxID=8083 RepID=UPI000C6DDFE5|nr:uncharacterized protein LOC111608882 [Xiphophorus maculatus]